VLVTVSVNILLPHSECNNWRQQASLAVPTSLHGNITLLQTAVHGKKTLTLKMGWAGHVAHVRRSNAQNVLIGKPTRKSPLGKRRRKWADNVNIKYEVTA
jgi:hypothetical protein